MIPSLNLNIEAANEANLLIYEQKYIDLIEKKQIIEALEVLRTKIKPFSENSDKLHKLASLIMCQTTEELYEKAGISSSQEAKKQLLMNIRAKCKPDNMIEPNRLENLLSQAVTYQMITCKYHSSSLTDIEKFSLIEQHKCTCEETPSVCYKTMNDRDEVWIVKFSPNGEKFATVCKKASLSIWEFRLNNSQPIINVYHLFLF